PEAGRQQARLWARGRDADVQVVVVAEVEEAAVALQPAPELRTQQPADLVLQSRPGQEFSFCRSRRAVAVVLYIDHEESAATGFPKEGQRRLDVGVLDTPVLLLGQDDPLEGPADVAEGDPLLPEIPAVPVAERGIVLRDAVLEHAS